jgi:hypothetical protein
LVTSILVLLPFHALLSVAIGGIYGGYDAVKLWAEGLLILLALPIIHLIVKDKNLWRRLQSWPGFWAMAAYVGLSFWLASYALAGGRVTAEAATYGLVVNLRFIWFFVACGVVATRWPWLVENWRKILLIPASIVVVFGLLQIFVLPDNVLSYVGYSPDTIPAYQTVDQKPDYVRVQSTLRGANPLGAYSVIIIAAAVTLLLAVKNDNKRRWQFVGLLAGSLIVLGYTYSRSAYLGAAMAVAAALWLVVRNHHARRVMLVAATALLLIGSLTVLTLRNNDAVQNVLFHTNEHSISPNSSNADRANALEAGLKDLRSEPLGRGPGTAGPASVYNGNSNVRISENYYLQIGQEVGWLGLALFLITISYVGWALFRTPGVLSVILLTSFLGISVINLLWHAWTDDTLSLLWWGMAGVAIFPDILKDTRKAR